MDFRNLQEIGTAIQARHITVPIDNAFTVEPDANALEIREQMLKRSFDYAPVIQGRHVVGLFSALAGVPDSQATALSCARGLEEDLLLTDSTPVAHLFDFMGQEPFLFVVAQRRISGFVTTTDLGAPPVRTHFYLLFAAAEMAMAALVRRDYPDQRVAVSLLNRDRQVEQAKLMTKLQRKDEVLDDVAALSFGDLLLICGENETLKAWMAGNGRSFSSSERGLAHFRNDVMHPVRRFTDGSPKKIAKLARYDQNLAHLIRGANQVLGFNEREP